MSLVGISRTLASEAQQAMEGTMGDIGSALCMLPIPHVHIQMVRKQFRDRQLFQVKRELYPRWLKRTYHDAPRNSAKLPAPGCS